MFIFNVAPTGNQLYRHRNEREPTGPKAMNPTNLTSKPHRDTLVPQRAQLANLISFHSLV